MKQKIISLFALVLPMIVTLNLGHIALKFMADASTGSKLFGALALSLGIVFSIIRIHDYPHNKARITLTHKLLVLASIVFFTLAIFLVLWTGILWQRHLDWSIITTRWGISLCFVLAVVAIVFYFLKSMPTQDESTEKE